MQSHPSTSTAILKCLVERFSLSQKRIGNPDFFNASVIYLSPRYAWCKANIAVSGCGLRSKD
eukprot:12401962-Karenia_brevis.AAC.1